MIYASAVLPVEKLDGSDQKALDKRHIAVDGELKRLARERGRLERHALSSIPGRLAPEVGKHLPGDVVVFMVDAGQGQAVQRELLEYLSGEQADAA